MVHFLLILLLFIIIVPLLFAFGIALKFWNMLTGRNNNYKQSGFGSGRTSSSSSRDKTRQQSSSTNYGNQSAGNGQNKIFKDGQAEYVDFEEIE